MHDLYNNAIALPDVACRNGPGESSSCGGTTIQLVIIMIVSKVFGSCLPRRSFSLPIIVTVLLVVATILVFMQSKTDSERGYSSSLVAVVTTVQLLYKYRMIDRQRSGRPMQNQDQRMHRPALPRLLLTIK